MALVRHQLHHIEISFSFVRIALLVALAMSRAVLNKLLSHSFLNYQLLYSELSFHNHNSHHLGSLYLLGASDEQLEKAYESMCKYLDPYEPSPEEVNLSNWRKFLGNKHFCQGYRDFYHQQLTSSGNQWQKKFTDLLLENPKQPLINGAVGGLGHPLIHVGYALELESEVVGAEALAMTAVCYNYLHEVVDQLKPPKSPSKTALEIFKDIRSDPQLPVYDAPGVNNLEPTVKNNSQQILSHYNQWNINRDNLEKATEELFDLSVYLYGATHKPNEIEFDFFLLHLLTSMHAIRVIHRHLDDPPIFEHILFQFFYFAIVIYIAQLRPEINEGLILDYQLESEKSNWNYVIDRALNTKLADDAHAVKAIRALRDAEKAYGEKNGLYLKTAVKSVDHLDYNDTWVGGSNDVRQLNVLKRS